MAGRNTNATLSEGMVVIDANRSQYQNRSLSITGDDPDPRRRKTVSPAHPAVRRGAVTSGRQADVGLQLLGLQGLPISGAEHARAAGQLQYP